MIKMMIFFNKLKNVFHKLVNRIRYHLFYLKMPVNKNLVFLESFQGRSFSDNPKALYLEMINNKEYINYYFIVALRNIKDESLSFIDRERTRIVHYKSSEYYKAIAQAKYLISNAILDMVIIKKKDQIYLQTWHGTPLKKLGWDLKVSDNALNNSRKIKLMYLIDAKRYNLMCSASPYYTEKIISAFNLKNLNKIDIIKETGYPRNDILINSSKERILKIKQKLKLPLDKKIILYAPTWRENNYNPQKGYENNLSLNLEEVIAEIDSDYIIILRLHYLISNLIDIDNERIIDLSNHDDINDLYLVSELLISDYSSAIFDYSLLNKPMIYYLADLEQYKNKSRGLYFDITKLPGPIAYQQKQLIEYLNDIDNIKVKYQEQLIDFKNEFNPYEDGNSSQRVVKELLKIKTKNEA